MDIKPARVPPVRGRIMSETFAARANAIFGALEEPTKPAGWQLDPAQGFKPGAEDASEQDSSEDGEEAPEPESLPGADDSEEEQSYKRSASKCYRRAFEREEEEDEFDRVAAGATSQEQERPARSMEVLEDNVFDRMHSQSYRATPAGPSTDSLTSAAALEHQQPMDLDEGPPPLEPAAVQHVRDQQQQQWQQLHEQQQENVQDQLHKAQIPSGQAWMPAQTRSDRRLHGPAAQRGQQQHNGQHQHEPQRRVRFVDANSHAEAGVCKQQMQQQQGWGRGSRVAGRGRGGRRGQSFVPDHVRNPQKYTVCILDEPLYVGQGDKDTQEMRALDREHRPDYINGQSSRVRRGAPGTGTTAAVDVGVDHGRWQDHDDDAPMLLSAAAAGSGADADLDGITAVAESVRQLPPTGSIKFQPSSKRAKIQKAAGTASESQVAHQGNEARAQDNRPPESTPAPSGSTVLGAFVDEQTQDDEPADGASIAATTAAAAHGRSSRQRHYRRKAATDEA